VVVFDEDAAQGAPSWGNAGHIAVEQVEPLASPDQLRAPPNVCGCLAVPWVFGPKTLVPGDLGSSATPAPPAGKSTWTDERRSERFCRTSSPPGVGSSRSSLD
jgi:hypothetical protein